MDNKQLEFIIFGKDSCGNEKERVFVNRRGASVDSQCTPKKNMQKHTKSSPKEEAYEKWNKAKPEERVIMLRRFLENRSQENIVIAYPTLKLSK